MMFLKVNAVKADIWRTSFNLLYNILRKDLGMGIYKSSKTKTNSSAEKNDMSSISHNALFFIAKIRYWISLEHKKYKKEIYTFFKQSQHAQILY